MGKQSKQSIANALDEKEREVLDLNEASNALCGLQKEFEAKIAESEENESVRLKYIAMYQRIEKERNQLQIEYSEIYKKYQCNDSEYKSKSKELIETQNTLKNTLNKLQQITLQNDALKDDLATVSNDN